MNRVNNEMYNSYLERYESIERDFIKKVESFGLPFNKDETAIEDIKRLHETLREKGADYRNRNKSICTGEISSACKACAKGVGSATIYISLMCNRSCYYCFNPNQEDFKVFSHQKNDWRKTLENFKNQSDYITHLALTGGEPLLHKDDTLEFFKYIQNNLNNVHTRLYTAGDLLDENTAKMLRDVGLQEIRFSIKLEDDEKVLQKVLANLQMAKEYIPDVMVEMPVIPGTDEQMRDLLQRLENIGIYSINLLEFCFPLYNVEEFNKRGFKLKYPPFETLYNYWYAGGLAVDGSEMLCLELLEFAIDKKFNMSVHYCSLENKYTGQIYLQNAQANIPDTMEFSQEDFFLKTGKVFEEDIPKVIELLERINEINYKVNEEYGYLEFHPKHLGYISRQGIEAAISFNILEYREDDFYIRELKLLPYKK